MGPEPSLLASPALALGLYQTQDAAQAHCHSDTVVWLNIHSGIYHFQVNAGTAAQNMAPTCARKRRMRRGIGPLRMGSSNPMIGRKKTALHSLNVIYFWEALI